MNTRDQLNQYLQGLEKRMRWLAVSKGAAVAAGVVGAVVAAPGPQAAAMRATIPNDAMRKRPMGLLL